jgi:thioredoxin reductase (NADPH)
MFLCRTASHVRLIVRGPSLAASMSNYLSSRLEADPAISIEYDAEIVALQGTDKLHSVTIRNTRDGSCRDTSACAVFVMIGATPNTSWLSDMVELDKNGFVLTGAEAGADSPYATSRRGIFAVGDVRSSSVKRVASSVGEGSVVISKVWEHLKS